jgi:hypothetical protein
MDDGGSKRHYPQSSILYPRLVSGLRAWKELRINAPDSTWRKRPWTRIPILPNYQLTRLTSPRLIHGT